MPSRMGKFWQAIKAMPTSKKAIFSFIFLVVGGLVVGNVARAAGLEIGTVSDGIINMAGRMALSLATLCLKLSIFVLSFVIEVAGYNGYINSTAVDIGWVMVRDVCNMFFVLILLLIAFGTILGIEQYEWKKMLVKLVLAAVLINFSRTICGVIIDAAQVVMVTFVNGVAATAGGNLINMFEMDKILSMTNNSGQDFNAINTAVAGIAGLGFAAIMLATLAVFLVILVARLVVLWILIVLSPFAFVFSVIPQTQKYAGQWWQEFGNHVLVGPVCIFFVWLAFVTVGGGGINTEIASNNIDSAKDKVTGSQQDANSIGTNSETASSLSAVMEWTSMANFFIAIGMLLVGAKITQSLGATGGSMMSKAVDFGKKVAMVGTGVAAGMWVGRGIGKGASIAKDFAINKAPLVGKESWQRRGLAIQDWGLNAMEKHNQSAFARLTGFQFGKDEKIIKERKRAIEARKGALSSSAKGMATGEGPEQWELLKGALKFKTIDQVKEDYERDHPGKKLSFTQSIDEFKSYVNEQEGKQELNKGMSEQKRVKERMDTQTKILQDEKRRAKYADRHVGAEEAQTKLDTAKVQAKIEFMKGDKGESYFDTRSTNLAAQETLLNKTTLGVEKSKTAKAKAAETNLGQRLEGFEPQEDLLTPGDVNVLNNQTETIGNFEADSSIQKAMALSGDQSTRMQELESRKANLNPQENNELSALNSANAIFSLLDILKKVKPESSTDADKIQSFNLYEQINDPITKDLAAEKRKEWARANGKEDYEEGSDEWKKQTGQALLEVASGNNVGLRATARQQLAIAEANKIQPKVDVNAANLDKQIELLQKISDSIGKDGKVDISKLADIKSDENFKPVFNGMFGKNFDNTQLEKIGNGRLGEILNVLKQAQTRKTNNQQRATDRAGVVRQFVQEQVKAGKFSAPKHYYKVQADEEAALAALRGDQLKEAIEDEVVAKPHGYTVPSSAGGRMIDFYFDRDFKSMGREEQLGALKGLSAHVVESRKKGKEYTESEDYKKDLYRIFGLFKQLHGERYQDDAQGTAEKFMQDYGLEMDSTMNQVASDAKRAQAVSRGGSGNHLDLARGISTDSSKRSALKQIIDTDISVNLDGLSNPTEISKIAQDISSKLNSMQLSQAGLGSGEQLLNMLKSAAGNPELLQLLKQIKQS